MNRPGPSLADLESVLAQGLSVLPAQPRLAATRALEILQVAPNHQRARLLLGVAQRQLGAVDDSVRTLAALAALRPDWGPPHYELGLSLKTAARPAEALAALRRAVQVRPDIGEGWRLIADLSLALGDPAGADRAFANHLAVSAADPGLRQPAAALCADRLPEAESALRMRLAAQPADAPALRMLAEVMTRAGRFEDAEQALSRALDVEPGFVAARYSRAVALRNLGRAQESLAEIEILLAADPCNPTYLNVRANALTGIGEFARAIDDFKTVLADYPSNAKIWLAYGHALRTAGRRDDAVAAYRRSIELAPRLGESYWSLANMKTFRFAAGDIDAMRAQVARPDLGDEDRVHLHFALGKALEDARDFAPSFEHYATGNRVRRAGLRYDAEDTTRFVQRSTALFTEEFFRERAGSGYPADDPIFVVGMPRSGSTLVEQILSSHSQVEGTMELPDMTQVARAIVDDPRNEPRLKFPEVLARVTRDDLVALGERYLRQTRVHRKAGRAHFIDKLPNNWMHAGLIHLILPNARIVDARRHPLACCFSNFKQLFARGQQFSYSFTDLARYCCDYLDLMAHFDRVLPGRVHRVIYESVVEDTEREVRSLLDYCGLPFEESCLRFHETTRAVRTPSSEQVRQPIFRDGIDQWRNYEAWLVPLQEALGPALDDWHALPAR